MIIAIDFDGTMCEDNYPYTPTDLWPDVIEWIKEGVERGNTVNVYTCRSGNDLIPVRQLLERYGLDLTINDLKAPWGEEIQKMFAHFYIDNRCPWFPGRNWTETISWDYLESLRPAW